MLDLDAIEAEAQRRLQTASHSRVVANPANWLTEQTPAAESISQLATLAISHSRDAQAAVERACTDCRRQLRGGACDRAEAAGLFPPGHGHGIIWPPLGHAETCMAFAAKVPIEAPSRPHKLTQAEMAAAHAEPWDDGAIGRFQAREARLRRRGFSADDASDLAERQHLLDVQADGRAMCIGCENLERTLGGWRCGAAAVAGLGRELSADIITLAQRCPGFSGAEVDDHAG